MAPPGKLGGPDWQLVDIRVIATAVSRVVRFVVGHVGGVGSHLSSNSGTPPAGVYNRPPDCRLVDPRIGDIRWLIHSGIECPGSSSSTLAVRPSGPPAVSTLVSVVRLTLARWLESRLRPVAGLVAARLSIRFRMGLSALRVAGGSTKFRLFCWLFNGSEMLALQSCAGGVLSGVPARPWSRGPGVLFGATLVGIVSAF